MSVWPMLKKVATILLLSLIIVGNVHAVDISKLDTDLSNIIKQQDQEADRLKLVDLVIQENRTAKLIRAYKLAVESTSKDDIKPTQLSSFTFDPTSDKPAVVQVGEQWINNSVYAFGGGRNSSDISKGLFDCSSFVHWAFEQVGINLGNKTSVTTDTLKVLGDQVDRNDIVPGDLVFFDTYKIDGHVGIYAGNGQFIGSQSSTGVAYADMTTGYWADKFNNRVIRIDEAY